MAKNLLKKKLCKLKTVIIKKAIYNFCFPILIKLGINKIQRIISKFYNFSIKKKDFEPFTNFNNINTPKPLKVLPKIILTFLGLTILILCLTPWQQTSKGLGHIIATDPNDRAQNISAPINGRIKKWFC